ncbi:MAG TPA: solute:sodium symporter family transporter [Lachnospiraceae bacterium]|nr:solute:sodium symporter family transporter [Lachnospiraceae bacterium]
MGFTLFSFAIVTVLVFVISWWRTRDEDENTAEGYFLGGRSLTGVIIFGSLMMTNLSAEQLVGRNGQGYTAGMTAMGWESMCPIALTLMAVFFVPKYLKRGITTIPEFLEDRFDRSTRVLVSFIFLVAYIVTMLPLVLYAGSVAMERIFDVTDMVGDRFLAITIMCVLLGIIGGIYAIFGGLKAVAVSDTLNGIIFIAGAAFLIPVLAFIALGDGNIAEGIRTFATASPEHLNAIQPADAQAPYIPWPMIIVGCGINHVSYYCTNQSIMQRVLGAVNLKEAQKGALLSGLVLVFCPVFLVAPGIIQFIRDGGVLTDFDMAYPTLVKDILPTPVLGFFAAVMFGAILSSFNSVLNSSMTLFTLDILPAISRKERSAPENIAIAKRFGIFLCLASISIAPFLVYLPAGISTFLNQMWGYYGVPVLAIAMMGMLNRNIPDFAPKLTIAVHIIGYGLMMNLLPFHFLYFETASFVLDLVLLWACAKLKPRKTPYELKNLEVVDMTPWKYRWPVIIVTFAVLIGMYALFSPLGLGA